MTKIRITKRERFIIKALLKRASKGKDTFTLDWLCTEVYPDGAGTQHDRASMAATLRNFAGKIMSIGGYRLRRTSGMGVGARAEYEFAGDFAKLIKDTSQTAEAA